MQSSGGPTKSQASVPSRSFTWWLDERLVQRRQLLQASGHRAGAADDVVHDRDGLAVPLAEPRLLERVVGAALLVLLTQELEVDPPVVGLDDLGVVVHLRVGVVEARDQAPLTLHVPVAVQVAAEERG